MRFIEETAGLDAMNMIPLLREKDYELLGNIEIREADWLRLRRSGVIRFVVNSCSASFGGRVGAGLILLIAVTCLGKGNINVTAWMGLIYGAFSLSASVVYAVRAWFRLEGRFARRAANTG
jgi:hypothetical protein